MCDKAPDPVASSTESGIDLGMDAQLLPSAADVKARLKPLTNQQLERLAVLSGVPYHTLLKIRTGETENPRIDTVRQFLGHVNDATA